MRSYHRIYNSNGDLVAITKKEMSTRGNAYYKKHKINTIKEYIAGLTTLFIVIVFVFLFSLVVAN